MYTIHLHDKDYNEIGKYKAIGSLSQVEEGLKQEMKKIKAAHAHVWHNFTLVYEV